MKKLFKLVVVAICALFIISGNAFGLENNMNYSEYMNIDYDELDYNSILEYKEKFGERYKYLGNNLKLPDGFDESIESYNALPKDTKDIIQEMKILEELGFKLMNAEAMKISEFEKSFKTMVDRSIFDNLSIGDILVTDDNKSYHVINHGHAAMLYDGDHICRSRKRWSKNS